MQNNLVSVQNNATSPEQVVESVAMNPDPDTWKLQLVKSIGK